MLYSEINYESEAIGEIINDIFGLNILNLNDNAQVIINALANAFGMNLDGIDVASISFVEDGNKFYEEQQPWKQQKENNFQLHYKSLKLKNYLYSYFVRTPPSEYRRIRISFSSPVTGSI